MRKDQPIFIFLINSIKELQDKTLFKTFYFKIVLENMIWSAIVRKQHIAEFYLYSCHYPKCEIEAHQCQGRKERIGEGPFYALKAHNLPSRDQ